MNLTGVDVRVLVTELRKQIIGSWVVNIYHLPSGIFLFKLRKPQEGLLFLLIEPGKRIHLSLFNRVMPKEPSNFCKTLRKHLRDRRINEVDQRDLDRIVVINLGPDEGFTLVIELFGRGNMIMVSPLNKIISASSYRRMRDRDIHPGRDFIHMPPAERDILRHGTDDLQEYLDKSKKLIPALNTWLGLGPHYSRYILANADITTKKSDDLSSSDITTIIDEAERLKSQLENNEYDPVVYLDSSNINIEEEVDDEDSYDAEFDEQWADLAFNPEHVVKILPWIQGNEDTEIYHADSMGNALDIYFSSQESEEEITEETEMLSTESERLHNQLTLQLNHQQEFIEEGKKIRRDADILYENFQPASELLKIVYDARKNNMEWEEIENRLQLGKEKGIPAAMLFQSLEIDKGRMNLILPTDNGERIITVDFRKSLTDIANELYTKAKKTENKAKGADIAIERTRKKIEVADASQESLDKRVSDQVIILKRRKAWYEKWHWTIAESGALIIAGHDAVTNERMVKTYLDADDLFLHADIQGAAATIIKTEGKEVSEATKKVAASISVSYSAAWKLKRPTADAYLVTKDQVSLSAPSGQFLPQGGFMIYGEREYINDVPLKLFIGLIVERHWAKTVLATNEDSHLLSSAAVVVEIEPGDDQRGTVAKKLKKGFLQHVKDSELNKVKSIDIGDLALMIPGPSQITRWIKNKKD